MAIKKKIPVSDESFESKTEKSDNDVLASQKSDINVEECEKAVVELAVTMAKKPSLLDKLRNRLGVKKAIKNEKKTERNKVADTLDKIDNQLNMLTGHNTTLLEEVHNLRKSNNDLINEILKIRKREFISKIIAIISGTISVVLILLKILQWTM